MSDQSTRPTTSTNPKIDPQEVAQHLRVAADKYHENARLLLEQLSEMVASVADEQKATFRGTREALAKLFDEQASDALRLALVFDDATCDDRAGVPAVWFGASDPEATRRLCAALVGKPAEPPKFSRDAGHNELATDLAALDGNAHPISEVIASGQEVARG